MRGVPIAAVLAALTLVACKGKDAALDKNLANDLDLAGSAEHLALAPTGPAQMVESPIERSQARGGAKLAIEATHQPGGTLHAMPHVILTPTAPMLVPTTVTSRKSTTVAPRSQAAPVGYPSAGPTIIGVPPGKGGTEGDNSPDNGTGHGGWGVLRGGAIEGDHCAPPPPTSVNNPLPGIGNGTF